MSNLFLRLLNISITAGWIVFVVVLLRFVLKKAPKWTRVVLWGLVALRLLLPVSIESPLSLVPSEQTVSIATWTLPDTAVGTSEEGSAAQRTTGERVVFQTGFPALNSAINPTMKQSYEHHSTVSAVKVVAGWVWLAGVVGMLFYALISFLRLKHRVRASVLLEKGAYVCDEISDPFILGLIVPKIYLPSGMDEQTRAYVLAHERAHLKRFDHIWKPLGFLLLSVYWFNPLLWLAYILLCRDIELACDEKVVKELDDAGKAAYSEVLVTASVSRRSIAACPLAFGETGVKSRVKSVLNYKKPAFWIILVAILACIAVAVCFLTVPRSAPFDPVGVWEIQESASSDLYISMVTRLEFQENGTGSLIIVNNENSTRTGTAFKYTVSRKTINLLTFHGEKTELTYDTGTDSLRYRPRIDNDHLSPVNPLFWDVRYGIANEMQHHILGELYELVYVRAGSEQQSPADKVTEWVNYYENTDDITWDGYKEITLDAFPNVTFRWTSGSVEAIESGKTRTLFQGMPVWNVYLTDITGDGKPELIATVSFGSGIVDDHIVVYDYVNRQSYTLWDRFTFDYHLYMADGQFLVGKTPYNGDKQVDYGTLVMHDGVLCCQWHSDGSFTPLNRELHESELYGEWLVKEETDNDGNVLYAFGALAPWKEYNFKEDGTVIYNETVPYSSDSELAFGHPVAYPYEVHDNYVYIAGDNTSGAFRWGQYDRDTRTLTLMYNTDAGTVYAKLRRMGTEAPQSLREMLLGTYVCTTAERDGQTIPVPDEYAGMKIDLGDSYDLSYPNQTSEYFHVAYATVGGVEKAGYDWTVDENDMLVVWNPETGDTMRFEWYPKEYGAETLRMLIPDSYNGDYYLIFMFTFYDLP